MSTIEEKKVLYRVIVRGSCRDCGNEAWFDEPQSWVCTNCAKTHGKSLSEEAAYEPLNKDVTYDEHVRMEQMKAESKDPSTYSYPDSVARKWKQERDMFEERGTHALLGMADLSVEVMFLNRKVRALEEAARFAKKEFEIINHDGHMHMMAWQKLRDALAVK